MRCSPAHLRAKDRNPSKSEEGNFPMKPPRLISMSICLYSVVYKSSLVSPKSISVVNSFSYPKASSPVKMNLR